MWIRFLIYVLTYLVGVCAVGVRGQRENGFSPSTVWILGPTLGSLGFMTRTFACRVISPARVVHS